jgi:hypothetical protein
MRWTCAALLVCVAGRAQAADHLAIERFAVDAGAACDGADRPASLRLYVSLTDSDGVTISGRDADQFGVVFDLSDGEDAPKIRGMSRSGALYVLEAAPLPRDGKKHTVQVVTRNGSRGPYSRVITLDGASWSRSCPPRLDKRRLVLLLLLGLVVLALAIALVRRRE